MPKYLLPGKYTAEGLATVRKDGYVTWPKNNAGLLNSLGGALDCMYFTIGGEWDFCAIVECSADDLFAIYSTTGSSGVFERAAVHELGTAEEADASINSPLDWTPPGEGNI